MEKKAFMRSIERAVVGVKTLGDAGQVVLCAAWRLLKLRGLVTPAELEGRRIDEFVESVLGEVGLNDESLERIDVSDEELKEVVLSGDWRTRDGSDGIVGTSASLTALALRLLGVGAENRLVDWCSGIGDFMVAAVEDEGVERFSGVEINYNSYIISLMRAALLDADIDVTLGDALEYSCSADRAFVDAPKGARASIADRALMKASLPEGIRVASFEWAVVSRAYASLEDGGRLAAIIVAGAALNARDAEIRRYFFESGAVEAVVALPAGVYEGTMVSVRLVLLAKDGRQRMPVFVDASNRGKRERMRSVVLSDADIEDITSEVSSPNGDGSVSADIQAMADAGWSMDPNRYLCTVDIDNGVPLGQLVDKIARGVQIRREDYEVRLRAEPTGCRYLRASDLSDEGIAEVLPYLDEVKPAEEKYCAQPGDVLLSKMPPYRAVIVKADGRGKILCSDSIYIIRPNADRLLPAYLKLVLGSSIGRAQLKALSVGTAISLLPAKGLSEFLVPEADMAEQKRIEREHDAITDEIALYLRKVDRARARLAALVEPEGDA